MHKNWVIDGGSGFLIETLADEKGITSFRHDAVDGSHHERLETRIVIAYIVVSHGEIATHLVAAARRISGNPPQSCLLRAIALDWGAGPTEIEPQVERVLASLPPHDGVVFLVDLVGGTPWNTLTAMVESSDSMAVIGGVNLPMVLRLCCGPGCGHQTLAELVDWCRTKGRDGIQASGTPRSSGTPELAVATISQDPTRGTR